MNEPLHETLEEETLRDMRRGIALREKLGLPVDWERIKSKLIRLKALEMQQWAELFDELERARLRPSATGFKQIEDLEYELTGNVTASCDLSWAPSHKIELDDGTSLFVMLSDGYGYTLEEWMGNPPGPPGWTFDGERWTGPNIDDGSVQELSWQDEGAL